MGRKKGKKIQQPQFQHPQRGPSREIRAGRKEIAQDTIEILQRGWYRTRAGHQISIAEQQEQAVANTVVYSPDESQVILDEEQGKRTDRNGGGGSGSGRTEYIVSNLTTLDAARQLAQERQQQTQVGQQERQQQTQEGQQGENSSIFVLNFASGRNPGGGFLGGSQAQEESLARASGLYPCLMNSGSLYYTWNRRVGAPLYTDYIIYSPNVPVFKNEDGSTMDVPVPVSFLTCPAVNKNLFPREESNSISPSDERLTEITMRRRISKLLAIAQRHGHDTLVLGAWGCGVFANDPQNVAEWFRDELRSFASFRKVVFAVYSPKNSRFIAPFYSEFMEGAQSLIWLEQGG